MPKLMGFIAIIIIILSVIVAADKALAMENLDEDLDSVQRLLERQLDAEETAKKKALTVAQEVYETREALIGAAKKIQDAESRVSNLEREFDRLKGQELEILEAIREKREQVAQLVAVLQAMSLHPVESFIVQEAEPVDVLRSSLLMRDIIPLITRKTEALKVKLADLAKIREEIRQQYLQIKTATSKLRDQQQQITILLNRKITLQKDFEKQAKQSGDQAKRLAAKARDLQELIIELERQKSKNLFNFGVTDFDFAGMKGKLPFPVKGEISKKYGETLESGIISKGISVKGRGSAQVIAPFDGTVVFSGPFRDYRDVLIIDHGGGYHTLLAGMKRNDTVVGQGLLAGEPVGMLSDDNAVLYVEIRSGGNAVNPAGWFAK